jgi:outer membrane protein assembly factor BamB
MIAATLRHTFVSEMGRAKILPLTFLFSLLVLLVCPVSAQTPPPAPAWQKSFPHSIDWYVRTSAGVLLVRAGRSLTALDDQDGRQLWSFPEIEIGARGILPNERGKNLLEVPGLPILLLNRAKLPGKEGGQLLGINLWSGEIQWQQPELDDFLNLVPLYDSGRVLLLTKRIDKKLKTAILISRLSTPFLWAASLPSFYWSGPYPFRPELVMLDPLTGKIDWTQEYPHTLAPGFLDFQQFKGQLYLHEFSVNGNFLLGAIDLRTGRRLWEFKDDSILGADTLSPLLFVSGRVVLPAKKFVALDPSSNHPVWTIRKLGRISGILVDGDSILAVSGHRAFAIDAATGAVRWKMSAKSDLTNPVLLPEENAVIFCNKIDLLVIDISSGKVLRQAKTGLDENPITLRRVGKEFLLATREYASSLFHVSGERISDGPVIETVFPALSFAVSQPFPSIGTREVHEDFRDQLDANWTRLSEMSAGQSAQPLLDRLHPYLKPGAWAPEIYLSKAEQSGKWRFWRIDPTTGNRLQLEVRGSMPDANAIAGIVYVTQSDTLRAIRFPNSTTTASLQ